MSKFKAGEKVIWYDDLDKPSTMHVGEIETIQGEWAYLTDRDPVHVGFLFPFRVRNELQAIVIKREELKKAWQDSMELIYQLNNAIVRGEK